ncbi:MAG: SRPBCC family protein [Gammaproteobacteria bacterium]|nr:SRPBCC family protein [Gammaproteobacteria bacterium]
MKDIIQREITIKASKERIYAAIADPEKVVLWFPQTLEGRYAVGEQPVFGFGEHGKNRIYVVEAQPHSYFAYRWVPGASHFMGDVLSVPTTLVEFRIDELENGICKVTLTESGFAELPAESFKQNSEGWDFMLGRLLKHFTDQ